MSSLFAAVDVVQVLAFLFKYTLYTLGAVALIFGAVRWGRN